MSYVNVGLTDIDWFLTRFVSQGVSAHSSTREIFRRNVLHVFAFAWGLKGKSILLIMSSTFLAVLETDLSLKGAESKP